MLEIVPYNRYTKNIQPGETIELYIGDKYAGKYDVIQRGVDTIDKMGDMILHLVYGYYRTDVEKMLARIYKCTRYEIKNKKYVLMELKKV